MMHVWKRLLAALLAIALTLPLMGAMAEPVEKVYGVCTGEQVNVRKTANGNKIWFKVDEGHVGEILGTQTEGGVVWYKINTTHPVPNGRTYIGYIAEEFFRPMTQAETDAYLKENEIPEIPEDEETGEDEEDNGGEMKPSVDDVLNGEDHVEYDGTAVTGAKGEITTKANFRTQPTTKAGSVIRALAVGTVVDITGIPPEGSEGWYRIKYGDATGYVYSTLLKVVEAGEIAPDFGTEVTGAYGVVTADDVRFRAGAGTNHTELARLAEGTEVEILTMPDKISVNDWYRVRYNGQVGYIQSNFIRVTDAGDLANPIILGKGKVTGNNVNFRTGPGTDYISLGKLPINTEVELIVIPPSVGVGYWYQVRCNGKTGYIQSNYIKVLAQDTVAPPVEGGDGSDVVSTGVVTPVDGVRFRVGPGKNYDSLGNLPQGTVVELLTIPDRIGEDYWYKVRYNNKTGYIQSIFLHVLTIREEDLPETNQYGYAMLIKDSNVNLRETPGGKIGATWSGKGSLMRITGDAVPNGSYSWYPVYHRENSAVYFVREDMIEVYQMEGGQLVTPTPPPESYYGYVITTTYGVNVRILPYENSFAEVPRNTVLTCVGDVVKPVDGDHWWYKVTYKGRVGYVRGDCVRVCTATGGYITGDEPTPKPTEDPFQSTTIYGYVKVTTKYADSRVYMRIEPQGDPVGQVNNGVILPVMGKPTPIGMYGKYVWYPVRTADGVNGYIRGDLLTLCDKDGNPVDELPTLPPADVELVGATGKIIKSANFRKGTNTDSDIITVIPANTVVTVLVIPEDGDAGWYKVSYGGEKGYVHGSLITVLTTGEEEDKEDTPPVSLGYVMVTGSGVNIRQTPGGTILTSVNKNSVWPIIGVSIKADGELWFNIRANERDGYIHSDYAFKLSAEQEESYLAGNGVPESTPQPTEKPSNYLITTGSNLNVRESYSEDANSVGKVARGTVLKFFDKKKVGTNTYWYCVLYEHRELWVHGDYVEEMTEAEYQAWAAANADKVVEPDEQLGYLKTTQANISVRNAANGSTFVEKIATKGTVMRYYALQVYLGGYGWYSVLTPSGQFAYIRADKVEKCDENGDKLPLPVPDIGDTQSAPASQQETEYTRLKLGNGSEGTDTGRKVANLVQELINQGYYKGPVTYTYTSDVEEAVMAFQSVKGLNVDGIAGSATQHALFGTVPYGAGNTNNLDFVHYPVEKIDWFTGGIQQMIPRGANFKVYDVKTGIVWWAHRWAGAYHADIETLTAADSARLCEIYGVNNLQEIVDGNMWQRRPCLVTIGTRTFACSLDGMQHNPAGDTIDNNNMDGQICLHFTNSTSHDPNKPNPSTSHAEAIEYAYNHAPAGKK